MDLISGKYHPVGPSCTYKGKTVPCLVNFYEGGGISWHILTSVLRNLYYLNFYENYRENGIISALLVDENISCFDTGFLKYICDENHKLTIFWCSLCDIIVTSRKLNRIEWNIQN